MQKVSSYSYSMYDCFKIFEKFWERDFPVNSWKAFGPEVSDKSCTVLCSIVTIQLNVKHSADRLNK